jgi:hypothetical protein
MRKMLVILNAMIRDQQPFHSWLRLELTSLTTSKHCNCLDIQDSCCTLCWVASWNHIPCHFRAQLFAIFAFPQNRILLGYQQCVDKFSTRNIY